MFDWSDTRGVRWAVRIYHCCASTGRGDESAISIATSETARSDPRPHVAFVTVATAIGPSDESKIAVSFASLSRPVTRRRSLKSPIWSDGDLSGQSRDDERIDGRRGECSKSLAVVGDRSAVRFRFAIGLKLGDRSERSGALSSRYRPVRAAQPPCGWELSRLGLPPAEDASERQVEMTGIPG